MRYFIRFSYNGTNYHGWQYQPNAISVQQTLTDALSVILNEKIDLIGAGRTDSGVHASEMFAHFDSDLAFESLQITQKINSFLPKDISVFEVFLVHENAHARFDAKRRTYQYNINREKDVFRTDLSWHFNRPLNLELMNEAAKFLLEYTDFECFSKVHTDVNTFNCNINDAYWKEENGNLTFVISADRFLRNMVRAIVGTLINIGLEKISIGDFITIIESKDRSKAGFSVPAHGLFLTSVVYDYIQTPSPDRADISRFFFGNKGESRNQLQKNNLQNRAATTTEL